MIFPNNQLRSNINISGITADNDAAISGDEVNNLEWSISINLLYSPLKPLTFGVELMRAAHKLENSVAGKFDRFQFSAKYNINFAGSIAN